MSNLISLLLLLVKTGGYMNYLLPSVALEADLCWVCVDLAAEYCFTPMRLIEEITFLISLYKKKLLYINISCGLRSLREILSRLSVCFRDDAFTESVHRSNSAASSGPHHEERVSSRNDHQSPCEHTPEHHYGAALGRWDHFKLHGTGSVISREIKDLHTIHGIYSRS